MRNRLKIESAIKNAQAVIKIQEEFGSLDRYLWQFVDGIPQVNNWQSVAELPAKTAISEKMSKDLKKRGFNFVGPTICYAFMQAIGMVNDHTTDCFRYKQINSSRLTPNIEIKGSLSLIAADYQSAWDENIPLYICLTVTIIFSHKD